MGADAGCTRRDQTVGVSERAQGDRLLEATALIRELMAFTEIFET